MNIFGCCCDVCFLDTQGPFFYALVLTCLLPDLGSTFYSPTYIKGFSTCVVLFRLPDRSC